MLYYLALGVLIGVIIYVFMKINGCVALTLGLLIATVMASSDYYTMNAKISEFQDNYNIQ